MKRLKSALLLVIVFTASAQALECERARCAPGQRLPDKRIVLPDNLNLWQRPAGAILHSESVVSPLARYSRAPGLVLIPNRMFIERMKRTGIDIYFKNREGTRKGETFSALEMVSPLTVNFIRNTRLPHSGDMLPAGEWIYKLCRVDAITKETPRECSSALLARTFRVAKPSCTLPDVFVNFGKVSREEILSRKIRRPFSVLAQCPPGTRAALKMSVYGSQPFAEQGVFPAREKSGVLFQLLYPDGRPRAFSALDRSPIGRTPSGNTLKFDYQVSLLADKQQPLRAGPFTGSVMLDMIYE